MPPLTEDWSLFLRTDEHAHAANVGANSVPGILGDGEWVEDVDVEGVAYTFLCEKAAADAASIVQGTILTVTGVQLFVVRELHPTGDGGLVLILEDPF